MERDDPKLSLKIAGKSVGERLDEAIERGDVLRAEDGSLSLGRATVDRRDAVNRKGGFIGKAGANDRFCGFLNGFLFSQAYGAAQVPAACRSCFKVKISTRSLRALMAAREIAESTDHTTKSGSHVDDPMNSDLYGTYIYVDGLEPARAAHGRLREAVDAHPHLGPAVAMTIKRGCTNYERACGPSDQYTFEPGQEDVEAYLESRFRDEKAPRMVPKEAVTSLRMLQLIRTAYRIGDETYKDFTQGQPLFAPLVSYSPTSDESPDPASAPPG